MNNLGDIAVLIGAILGSSGIGGLFVYKKYGLGNGKGYRHQHLVRLDQLVDGQRDLVERMTILTIEVKQGFSILGKTLDKHEEGAVRSREQVQELLVRDKVRRGDQ